MARMVRKTVVNVELEYGESKNIDVESLLKLVHEMLHQIPVGDGVDYKVLINTESRYDW